jgi:hypothetical protein
LKSQTKAAAPILSPNEHFRSQLYEVDGMIVEPHQPRYITFDSSTGIPTHDHVGQPLTQTATKRVNKEYQSVKNRYQKHTTTPTSTTPTSTKQ